MSDKNVENSEVKVFNLFYPLEKKTEDLLPNINEKADVIFTNDEELVKKIIENPVEEDEIVEVYQNPNVFTGKLIGLKDGKFFGFAMKKECQECFSTIAKDFTACNGCIHNKTPEPETFDFCLVLLKLTFGSSDNNQDGVVEDERDNDC